MCSEKPITNPSIKILVLLCVNFIISNCTIVKINPDNTTVKTAFTFNINNVLINAKIEIINENDLFFIKLLFIMGYKIGAKTNRSVNNTELFRPDVEKFNTKTIEVNRLTIDINKNVKIPNFKTLNS